MGLEPASVRASTFSNMNISETSWPIDIKFHLEHHLGGGLAASGFGLDRIRTLVSMATDSSHRVTIATRGGRYVQEHLRKLKATCDFQRF